MPPGQDLFQRYEAEVARAAGELAREMGVEPPAGLTLEPPRDRGHGDLATNAAMVLAKGGGRPREIASRLAAMLARLAGIAAAEVAGPGFVNLRLADAAWHGEVARILAQGPDYGRQPGGQRAPVNIEFVSANPTGPLHMGHVRGAVVGDSLARLLEFAGERVIREYYVNDAGGQVDALARSLHWRLGEAAGRVSGPVPQGLYPGDYLAAPAHDLLKAAPALADMAEVQALPRLREAGVAAMLGLIRADLARLGIAHDRFTSERALLGSGAADRAEAALRARDLVYDGTLPPPRSGGPPPEDWEPVALPLFRSTRFGDDVDRPIRKSDGSWTYFGVDMANHAQKAEGASALVNIWGADHAGTVRRIQSAVEALTEGRVPLDVRLVQMVRLFRGGQPVKMSKRAGDFVTLAEVVDEVGADVVRLMMLTKRPEAPLDFDLVAAVAQSRENPVFYLHYAHARAASALRRAEEAGMGEAARLPAASIDWTPLDAEEMALARRLAGWPRLVRQAARAREPHRVAFWLIETAGEFHAWWNRGNDDPARRLVVEGEDALTAARLGLARATKTLLAGGLGLLGVQPLDELR